MSDDASPPPGWVTMERHQGALVVSLHGEHDVSTVDLVRDHLADARISDGVIVVDLTAASFIDSSVTGALYDAYQADAPPRTRFVAPVGTPPRRLFDLIGFDRVVPIYERLADTLGAPPQP
jgi:anti-sigma B factor antagonist